MCTDVTIVPPRYGKLRPAGTGKFPAILNYGPYAKGHAFQDSRKFAWERMIKQKPEVARGTSNTYQNWEVVDPEKWVPVFR